MQNGDVENFKINAYVSIVYLEGPDIEHCVEFTFAVIIFLMLTFLEWIL